MSTPERPRLILRRVAEDGRLSFERVLNLASLSLGRPLTPEEVTEALAFWSGKFPGAFEVDARAHESEAGWTL